MNTLTFDIETIPTPDEELSDIQKEEIQRKVDTYLKRNPSADPMDAKGLIMGTSPYFGKIIVIGVHKVTSLTTKSFALTGNEKDILVNFWKEVAGFSGVFVSYNGLSFDVPFIVKRSMKYGLSPSNKRFLKTYRYSQDTHFDAKDVISDYDRYASPTLHLACDLLGIDSPKEGEVKADQVAKAYEEGKLQQIADYCVRDVEATYKVYKKLKGIWV
jgi:hypothetical protein